jgi:UDP-N-acetylglucosamine enolpyruvyl transferase
MDDNEDVTEVEVTLDGTRFYIEAVAAGGEQQVSNVVVEGLQAALDSIKAIGHRVAETARAIEPDHFSGTASLTVNLEWDQPTNKKPSKSD